MGNSLWGTRDSGSSRKPLADGDLTRNLQEAGAKCSSTEELEILILGTGAGVTYVYSRQPSSSFVVLKGGEPVLLCDVGYGVTANCLQMAGLVPPHIYISHNHGDHGGELPVVLSVESTAAAAAGRGPPALYSHPDVMEELQLHRLRELRSTGRPLEEFAAFREVPSDHCTAIGDTGITIRPYRTRHSETCYGLVLYYEGKPFLGWTADSGYDEPLYRQLSEAPVLLVDARSKGTEEHMGFKELSGLVATPFTHGKSVYITGYGRQDDAPRPEDLPKAGGVALAVARPGLRIPVPLAPAL